MAKFILFWPNYFVLRAEHPWEDQATLYTIFADAWRRCLYFYNVDAIALLWYTKRNNYLLQLYREVPSRAIYRLPSLIVYIYCIFIKTDNPQFFKEKIRNFFEIIKIIFETWNIKFLSLPPFSSSKTNHSPLKKKKSYYEISYSFLICSIYYVPITRKNLVFQFLHKILKTAWKENFCFRLGIMNI